MKQNIRWLRILITGVFFTIALNGCNGSPSGDTATIVPPVTNPASATTEPMRTHTLHFDLNQAEGWSAYDDSEAWQTWMEAQGLLVGEADNTLGNFTSCMPLEEAMQLLPDAFQKTERTADGYITETIITFDAWTLVFISLEGEPYTLYSAETTDPRQATPRGLRIGDSIEILYHLYGIPVQVLDGIWTFSDGAYERFQVAVVDGKVERIKLCGVL